MRKRTVSLRCNDAEKALPNLSARLFYVIYKLRKVNGFIVKWNAVSY